MKKRRKTEKDIQRNLTGQEFDSFQLLNQEELHSFWKPKVFTAMNEAETKNDMTYVNPILSKEVEMRQRKKSNH